jgi:hypothetical protein
MGKNFLPPPGGWFEKWDGGGKIFDEEGGCGVFMLLGTINAKLAFIGDDNKSHKRRMRKGDADFRGGWGEVGKGAREGEKIPIVPDNKCAKMEG